MITSAPRVAAAATAKFAAAARLATSPPVGAVNKSATRTTDKKAEFTDPDMVHFRHTATTHPLYDKPSVVMPRPPVDPSVAAPGTPATGTTAAAATAAAEWANPTVNAVWTPEEMATVEKTHRPPKDFVDQVALFAIKTVRLLFDVVSGYAFGKLTPNKMLRRILFLETLAGIPGMVAGTLRHLESLRRMKRDHGWIHTLLEEAENERMHMLVFMKLYQPGLFFRSMVVIAQGIFWNWFFVMYLISPRFCHRFVGYLEEEAVRTYSHILEVMEAKEDKDITAFAELPALEIAVRYWKLPADSKMLDVVRAVRADEANHRDVNHTFANMKSDHRNPFLDHKQGPAAKHAADILKK